MLFISWSWNVGRDRIDTGYDLYVEPDSDLFHGQRFLVQVKGTDCIKEGGFAPVPRSRLRKYANSVIPVILVRTTSAGEHYWIHIQPWIKANPQCLAGTGKTKARVPMPKSQKLSEREGFTAYLEALFKPAAQSRDSLPQLVAARSSYLSSLHPGVNVRVGVKDGVEHFELFPTDENARLDFSFGIRGSEREKKASAKALSYGLPTSMDVDNFRFGNAKLSQECGMGNGEGKLHFHPANTSPVTLSLSPGNSRLVGAPSYSLSCTLYRGSSGVTISNEHTDDVLTTFMQVERPTTSNLEPPINGRWAFNADRLNGLQLRHCNVLREMGEVAEACLQQRAYKLDITVDKETEAFVRSSHDDFEHFEQILAAMELMGRLHKVAKAIDSPLAFDEIYILTKEDATDINFAYALLKGHHVRVAPTELEFRSEDLVVDECDGHINWIVGMALHFSIGEHPLGTIPVVMNISCCKVVATGQPFQYRMALTEESRAVVHHAAENNIWQDSAIGKSETHMAIVTPMTEPR